VLRPKTTLRLADRFRGVRKRKSQCSAVFRAAIRQAAAAGTALSQPGTPNSKPGKCISRAQRYAKVRNGRVERMDFRIQKSGVRNAELRTSNSKLQTPNPERREGANGERRTPPHFWISSASVSHEVEKGSITVRPFNCIRFWKSSDKRNRHSLR
jgi:hypothetical protein